MRVVANAQRGCGYKKKGGLYIVSEPSEDGLLPLWVRLNPPIPCEDRPHRSPVLVDADSVLARRPEEEWFVGSSADHREKLRADEWALDRFGMTTTMRLRTGECVGINGIDEAMNTLLHTVRFNHVYATDALSDLIGAKVQELPGVAPFYERMIQSFRNFIHENRAEELVQVAAMAWRIAGLVPPRKRETTIPFLIRILLSIKLTKDAVDMKKRYLS